MSRIWTALTGMCPFFLLYLLTFRMFEIRLFRYVFYQSIKRLKDSLINNKHTSLLSGETKRDDDVEEAVS